MLKAKLKYNVGSKPKDLAPVECSDRDRQLIENRVAKLTGQKPTSSHAPFVENVLREGKTLWLRGFMGGRREL